MTRTSVPQNRRTIDRSHNFFCTPSSLEHTRFQGCVLNNDNYTLQSIHIVIKSHPVMFLLLCNANVDIIMYSSLSDYCYC